MNTLVYFFGAAFELATRCLPRLGWRRQALRRVLLHARDAGVVLATMAVYATLLYVVAG